MASLSQGCVNYDAKNEAVPFDSRLHSTYIYQNSVKPIIIIAIIISIILRAAIAHSVQQLATGWTVRGSNPRGGQIFHTLPDPPSLLYNEYGVFPGG